MKLFLAIVALFISSSFFSQDTLHYTAKWEETKDVNNASYYSVTAYHLGTAGFTKNFRLNGSLHSEFRVENGKKNGSAIWYSTKGNMTESGRHVNGDADGAFKYYDEKGYKYKEAFFEKGIKVDRSLKTNSSKPEAISLSPDSDDRKQVILAEIIDFPEVEAQFVGGSAAMMKFIQKNVIYPEAALKKGDQGKVYVSFIVEKTGELSNLKIIRGVSKELDAEAMRVIQMMPKWIPAEKNRKASSSRMQLPIVFNLN